MSFLILPRRPRRAWLRSFWAALCVCAAVAALAIVGPSRWPAVLATTTLVLLPGLLRPQLVAPAYRLWDRLARVTALRVRRYTLWVCFHLFVRFASREVPGLRFARPAPGGSLWADAKRQPPGSYLSPHTSTRRPRGRGWVAGYLSWALRPGRLWMLGFLPSLMLLRLVALEEETEYPAGIYTLY